MRKFRLKANATGWGGSFIKGAVYDEDSVGKYNNVRTVLQYVQEFPNDWVEVFETGSKPLHKDTDLGYYAGLAMQGLMSATNQKGEWTYDTNSVVYESISVAKELIKQLNEETK